MAATASCPARRAARGSCGSRGGVGCGCGLAAAPARLLPLLLFGALGSAQAAVVARTGANATAALAAADSAEAQQQLRSQAQASSGARDAGASAAVMAMAATRQLVAVSPQPLVAFASWVARLHGAVRERAAALVQVGAAARREEPAASDDPFMRIRLAPRIDGGASGLTPQQQRLDKTAFKHIFFSALLWAALATAIAYHYRNQPEVADPKAAEGSPEELRRFSSEAFSVDDCLAEPTICFWSFCCPCIRWADSMDRLGFISYWVAFFAFTILWFFQTITAFVLFAWGLAIILTYYRHRTREAFGMKVQYLGPTLVADCCCFSCGCVSCLIAQEARHVKRAVALGHSAVAAPAAV